MVKKITEHLEKTKKREEDKVREKGATELACRGERLWELRGCCQTELTRQVVR